MEAPDKPSCTLKFILLGNSGVGKTTFRYAARGLNDIRTTETVGVDFEMIVLPTRRSAKGRELGVRLMLWDTAGQERYSAITRAYYRHTHCFVLVFDVTDADSFTDIRARWLRTIDEQLPGFLEALASGSSDTAVLLIGNKADLLQTRDRGATEEDIAALCADLGNCIYRECAATQTGQEIVLAILGQIVDGILSNPKAKVEFRTGKERTQKAQGNPRVHVVGERPAGVGQSTPSTGCCS